MMRRVLVTGGNKGIGKACCQKLLEEYPDVHVYLGSRDPQRGQEAVSDIVKTLGDNCKDRITCVTIDVSSDESVKEAATAIQKSLNDEKLFGIINNAGIMRGSQQEVVNVNYLGTKRVVDAFLSTMKRPGGRIVNIASASGPFFLQALGESDPIYKPLAEPWTMNGGLQGVDDLAKSYKVKGGGNVYGFSKALVNAYNLLLAREHPDLIINAVTPGWIKTDMTKGSGATNPPSKGAAPPVWALMAEELESDSIPTGLYYGSDCKRSPLNVYRDPGDDPYDGPAGLEIMKKVASSGN
jgi:NAD(P)-dependent dehydrogenase (short-subunit alcohol dehydrogenase family)